MTFFLLFFFFFFSPFDNVQASFVGRFYRVFNPQNTPATPTNPKMVLVRYFCGPHLFSREKNKGNQYREHFYDDSAPTTGSSPMMFFLFFLISGQDMKTLFHDLDRRIAAASGKKGGPSTSYSRDNGLQRCV